MLIIRDPELIKLMAIRDFEHFSHHRNAFLKDDTKESHIFGSSLFFLKNAKWKDMRHTLTPAFTGSKLRNMVGLMNDVAQRVPKYLMEEHKKSGTEGVELDLKDFAKRFTSDVIATTAFGLQVNSFADTENEFYVTGKKLTSFSFWQNVKYVLITNFGWLCKVRKDNSFFVM